MATWLNLLYLQVSVQTLLGNTVLIPDTAIPIDRSSCPGIPSGTSHTSPPPTLDPNTKTCQALQRIESAVSYSCHTNPACTSLACDIVVAQVSQLGQAS